MLPCHCAQSPAPCLTVSSTFLFAWLSEKYRAVLVVVSYLAVDALEDTLVKGDDRIARVWTHRCRLEELASKKWDNGEVENVAGMLRLQITAED